MKISIRASIMDLFFVLMLVVGTVIIGLNYFALEKILNESAQKLFASAGHRIKENVAHHLLYITLQLKNGSDLIASNNITPEPTQQFANFLLGYMMTNHELFAAYWGDPKGNYYGVERINGNNFAYETILRSQGKISEQYFKMDKQGNIISQAQVIDTNYDPRTRPWYKEAIKYKKLTWSNAYPFTGMINPTQANSWGITAAIPIYDKRGILRGVFALDQTLLSLSNFLAKLKTTEHAVNFIINQEGHLLATEKFTKIKNVTAPVTALPKLDFLNMPWVTVSFDKYHKSHRGYFSYRYQNTTYLAFYEKIDNIMHNNWLSVMVVPLSDITQPLKHQTTVSIRSAIFVMLIGLIFVSIIATRISRPIIKLADEAESIKNFTSLKLSAIRSIIREVIYLQNALNSLKNGLRSFELYIPTSLVKKLITTGEVAHVGGKNSELTFLFSDIKHFTSISENMQPQEVTTFLSEYFEGMSQIIAEQQGTIDKYIGDAIMAFWGAPLADELHMLHACYTALSMMNTLEKLNETWQAKGKPTIAIRIGIHSGLVTVGNVGSKEHLGYTVLGDNVNLTSRMEELNKLYHTNILVSDVIYHALSDKFHFRLVDQVAVRGKQRSVVVYELLPEENIFGATLAAYNDEFKKAYETYQRGDWQQALTLFESLSHVYPQDRLTPIFIARCKQFLIHEPENWQGVWFIKETN